MSGAATHQEGWGRYFPWVSILPGIFDGRECSVEAQGCRVMGENDISHECNTLGVVRATLTLDSQCLIQVSASNRRSEGMLWGSRLEIHPLLH